VTSRLRTGKPLTFFYSVYIQYDVSVWNTRRMRPLYALIMHIPRDILPSRHNPSSQPLINQKPTSPPLHTASFLYCSSHLFMSSYCSIVNILLRVKAPHSLCTVKKFTEFLYFFTKPFRNGKTPHADKGFLVPSRERIFVF
jgi:hypothetical protein